MPRAVTTAFATAVAAGTVQPCLLVEGLFDSGAVRLWTGYGPLTWGANTFTGAGTLIGISNVAETNKVEANGTKIMLTGIDSSVVSLALSEPYQGRIVNVYLGLFSSGALVADPDLLFAGRADVMTLADDGATCTIELAVEGRLVDLQRGRPRRYTDQDQKIDYPTDKGLEFVVAIQDKVVKWGGTS